MKNKIICLLLIHSFVNIKADTDPFFAQKGYTLLQDSWIFSPAKAKDVRDRLIDLDTYQKLNESLNKSIELYKKNEVINDNKINLLIEQNDRLAKSLLAERTVGGWERFGYFLLGIVATVGAGFAIKKAGD